MAEKTISVSLYVIRVTERRKRDPLVLSRFDGTTDLIRFIHDTLAEHQGNALGIRGGVRQVYVTNELKNSGRVVEGRVEVGNSGITASIKEIATGVENYRQKPTEAAMIPLYMRFWVPKGQRFGIAAFQHLGDAGCKSAIEDILFARFRERHEDFTLTFRHVVPSEYADELLKSGAIKEYRFVQFGVPGDIADLYGGQSLPAGTANVELRVVAKRGAQLGWTERIRRIIFGKDQIGGGALELDSFKCDDFRLRININGKDRMLKVGEFLKMNSRIEVTEEVEIGRDGHPTFESISSICESLGAKVARDLDVSP